MIAIVTAGGVTEPKAPLYPITHGGPKAMIDIHGKPMVQWVLDALSQSEMIDQVVVVGLSPETDLVCAHPLRLLPGGDSLVSSIRIGAETCRQLDPAATHAALISGDIPGLRGEIIDWLICQTDELAADMYYTVVERGVMESGFPEAQQSYTHLKDMQICHGNLHCFRLSLATEDSPLWQRLLEAPHSPFRRASVLGYDTLLFLMLRQLALQDAERVVSRRLGVDGRALLCPYPEVSMDVDKPVQLNLLREYLAKRHERPAARA